MANWFKTRQVREGGYSIAFILVFAAILAAANYLAAQYNETFDATKQKLYSLSDQTKKILGNLETDVTILFFDRKTRFREAENSLVRYENASSRVDVEYIDPDAEPEKAELYNVRSYGTTLVEVGGAREEATSSSEQDVTNAIIQALKGREKTACFIVGHGEADPSQGDRLGFSMAEQIVRDANYETETVNLPQNPEISANCSVVILAGPENQLLEPEVALLRDYVSGGGRLFLAVDFQKSPELVELASEWGVTVNDDVVVDRSGIGQFLGTGPLTPVATEYALTHPISEVMTNVATLFPMTRSVVAGGSGGDWSVTELIKTTDASFATSDFTLEGGELELADDADLQEGPINVAIAATYDVPEDAAGDDAAESEAEDEPEAGDPIESEADEASQARVVLVGTSRFARNYMIGAGANRDLFLNMLNWLTSDEDLISIRPKDPENTPMDITRGEMVRIFWGLVVGLPAMIILTGVRMWWVRR